MGAGDGRERRDQRRAELLAGAVRQGVPVDDRPGEHERGWRALERGRVVRRARGLLWTVTAGLAVAGAIVLVAGRRRAPAPLAAEVSGGELLEGGAVAVSSEDGAMVTLSDGTQIDVDPGAHATVASLDPRAARVRLGEGRVVLRVPEARRHPIALEAASFVLTTTGGEIEATFTGPTLAMIVRQGEARVAGPLRPQGTLVSAGQRVTIDLAHRSMRTTAAPQEPGATAASAQALDLSAGGGTCPTRYVEPAQQSALAAGGSSHWLQPWRAWLETAPAERLLDSVGITLGAWIRSPREISLLAAAGVKHATIEFGWDHYEPAENRFDFGADERENLRRLRAAGIRPTMLLNAYGGPPGKFTKVIVVAPAAAGDRELRIDAAASDHVVPGRTVLGKNALDVVVTDVGKDGVLTLSRPLPADVAPGPLRGTTHMYAPFRRPTLVGGEPDPLFQETLGAWKQYARAVVGFAREALGDDGFDVEVWNRYNGARDIFDVERYYDPLPADLGQGGPDAAVSAMLGAVIEVVRAPDAGFSHVRVANGFANRRWTESSLEQPPGVDALGRHLTALPLRFPQDPFEGKLSLDARGLPNGGRGREGDRWRESFTPAYDVVFPERGLTAIGDEPLYRDLSPLRSVDMAGNPHQRSTSTEVWIDSMSLGIGNRREAAGLSDAEAMHLKAKAALRAFSALPNKGVSRVMIYYHHPNETLFDARDPSGGEVLQALGRFTAAFRPASGGGRAQGYLRPTLESIDRCPSLVEFAGDGTPAHPPLRAGDVLAFFPYRVDAGRVVVPMYVMTRNMLRPYGAGPRRFDLPPARFRVRIGGVPAGASFALADPLSADRLPADALVVVEHTGDQATLELALTDAPRLLTITTR